LSQRFQHEIVKLRETPIDVLPSDYGNRLRKDHPRSKQPKPCPEERGAS
jgi:hypothetical protein